MFDYKEGSTIPCNIVKLALSQPMAISNFRHSMWSKWTKAPLEAFVVDLVVCNSVQIMCFIEIDYIINQPVKRKSRVIWQWYLYIH